MTVFRNEQEGLRYSISSNNSAIKYFTQQLEEMPFYEFYGDFGTVGAIRAGYKEIINNNFIPLWEVGRGVTGFIGVKDGSGVSFQISNF